jgi:hypothetical protein
MTIKSMSAAAMFLTIWVAVGHPTGTNIEQEIRKMEIVRLTFPKDSSHWADNVAEDALFMQGNGVSLTKQQTIEGYKQNEDENSTALSETQFRQSGDMAVFTYVSTRKRHDDSDRAVRHQHERRSVVYQRRGGKWQLVLLSAAVVPWGDGLQRPVDPKILDEYVGVYADFPPPSTVTFSRDGTRLMAQGSTEKEKTELMALSDDTFAVRGEFSQLYFERGPDGHFVRLWSRDIGGDQLEQKRLSK